MNTIVETAMRQRSTDLTGPTAAVINNFTNGLARAASGLLVAVGVSPLMSGLPYVVAAGVTTAVNVAAGIASTAMNAIANTITGAGQARRALNASPTSTDNATASTLETTPQYPPLPSPRSASRAAAPSTGTTTVADVTTTGGQIDIGDTTATDALGAATIFDDETTSITAEKLAAAHRDPVPAPTTSAETATAGATESEAHTGAGKHAAHRPTRSMAAGATANTDARHAATDRRPPTHSATTSTAQGGRHRKNDTTPQTARESETASAASQPQHSAVRAR